MRFPISPADFVASHNITTARPGVVVQHPDEHPWEPVYLRQYVLSLNQSQRAPACQTSTHDCDWALIVTLRDEACIPRDYAIRSYKDTNFAYLCPLLVEGYSVYETTNTSGLPFKYHLSSIDGVDLPVLLLARSKLQGLMDANEDYSYADLLEWEKSHNDIYRGFATRFSELRYHDSDKAVQEEQGEFLMTAEGYLPDGREFQVRIEEVGETYEPVVWEIDTFPKAGSSSSSISSTNKDDDHGLEGGLLAVVILAAVAFGILLTLVTLYICRARQQGRNQDARGTMSTSRRRQNGFHGLRFVDFGLVGESFSKRKKSATVKPNEHEEQVEETESTHYEANRQMEKPAEEA